MPRPKVKFSEFDEYYWRVIANHKARESRERWEQDRAHQDHLDKLLERNRWAKKYYGSESSSSSAPTQKHSQNVPNQNSNPQDQILNFVINDHLPSLNNQPPLILPIFSQELIL